MGELAPSKNGKYECPYCQEDTDSEGGGYLPLSPFELKTKLAKKTKSTLELVCE